MAIPRGSSGTIQFVAQRFLIAVMSDFHENLRFGGPQMADADGDDAARKAEERERKKAEVRKRLEEAGSKKKAKKGFLTPERKKKLRKLLMMKAAEDLKQQQLLKAQERQKALASRIIPLPDVDKIEDKGQLEKIYNDMFERVKKLEEEKYDINFIVTQTEAEINELTIAVNDLRGKFVKPTLKKVSKYDNKFKKMAENEKSKGEKKADFRANLKVVKKDTAIDDIMAKTKKNTDKPDWSKKPAAEKKEEEVKEAPPPAEEPEAEEEGAEGGEEEEEEEEEEE
nr:Troponin domain containing protein [Haemonchus contortus]